MFDERPISATSKMKEQIEAIEERLSLSTMLRRDSKELTKQLDDLLNV